MFIGAGHYLGNEYLIAQESDQIQQYYNIVNW